MILNDKKTDITKSKKNNKKDAKAKSEITKKKVKRDKGKDNKSEVSNKKKKKWNKMLCNLCLVINKIIMKYVIIFFVWNMLNREIKVKEIL